MIKSMKKTAVVLAVVCGGCGPVMRFCERNKTDYTSRPYRAEMERESREKTLQKPVENYKSLDLLIP